MLRHMIKRSRALPPTLWLSLALTGCYLGQTGPLYLPKEEANGQTPSEHVKTGQPAAGAETVQPERPSAKATPSP